MGDEDEVLEEIDHAVVKALTNSTHNNHEYRHDQLFYLQYRVSKSSNPQSSRIQCLNLVVSQIS